MLADGAVFSFKSAELSPVNDRERSPDSFRLLTGNDLHGEYAREQLAHKTLTVNMARKKLESSLVNLFAKRRTT